ncbi:jg12341 [Pararge aegeria aegeria]|uniref:Jg12341 protein n=1 Tax=Pararge aegeria aegeria TaxID=348720 RepID=A0A8S4R6E9_9NEOP|nr:jg12341 [Pararge aegeria aegeria]
MAALPAGVQYALSSESSYKENKELVFVKLTDSALKAIEDFIRNNRISEMAEKLELITLQYCGTGQDYIPTQTRDFNLN